MKFILALAGAVVVGAIAGIGSMLNATGLLSSGASLGHTVAIDHWHSNFSIGTDAIDPYTKTWVARFGLLALRREEAVYFTTTVDENGDRLTERCSYLLEGGDLPGAWWSFTVYTSDGFLPENRDGRMSFDATAADGAESWSVILSPKAPIGSEPWISTANAGAFDVTMRIYLPDTAFITAPDKVLSAPVVTPLECAAEASA